MSGYITVLSTISKKEDARKIAHSLIVKKLAACVNIVEGITSVYEWKGDIQNDTECLMIIKSKVSLFDKLKSEIKAMHPYELPEIIALPVTAGLEDYLKWINGNTLNQE